MSCGKDDEKDNREEVNVLVRAFNYGVDCNDQSLTYILETENAQRTLSVDLEDEKQASFTGREGEFINVKAFLTNDPTNTELAFANIEIRKNPNDTNSVYIVRIHYDNCEPLFRILWTFEFD
jgi:hypothetical protein